MSTTVRQGCDSHVVGVSSSSLGPIYKSTCCLAIVGVSDHATGGLGLVFNTDTGRDALREHLGPESRVLDHLGHFGYSSICNTLAAARAANELGLGPHDVVLTVATDGFEKYSSERERPLAERHGGRFDTGAATFV